MVQRESCVTCTSTMAPPFASKMCSKYTVKSTHRPSKTAVLGGQNEKIKERERRVRRERERGREGKGREGKGRERERRGRERWKEEGRN